MNLIQQIRERFDRVSSARDTFQGRVELLREQKREADEQIESLNTQYENMGSVLDILRKLAMVKEQVLRERLDNVVTRGLQLIFGSGYKSKMEFGIKRGQAVIIPKIVTEVNGIELEADIEDAHGGGLVNIVSVIYQILVLSLVKPAQRRLLFLDEPFANVSEDYLESAAEFVRQLNEKLGIQIVLITHRNQIAEVADKVYEFKLVDGITQCT